MEKKIVVYFSRTGNTEKVAEKIANELSCEITVIKPLKSYKGIIGWLRAGFQAVKRKLPDIESIKLDLDLYDLVIIGTPMWSGNMSSPVRTFLTKHANDFKNLAFFYSSGGGGSPKIFEEMNLVTKIVPIATLALTEKQDNIAKIESFVEKLK